MSFLIDKVDETEATSNSADKTATLIHPLLSRVQMMEVDGFSWIYFLWDAVKAFFEVEKYHVRLDKVGHATVSWDDEFFVLMLNKRVAFFSNSRLDFFGTVFERNRCLSCVQKSNKSVDALAS